MSQDGRGQRFKRVVPPTGVAEMEVSCGSKIYAGPAGGPFRKCGYGHTHCVRCGGIARKYGRANYSCIENCKI